MVLKEYNFIELFRLFIKDSYRGKRLKKDGRKIKRQTIQNYEAVLNLVTEFEETAKIRIRIKSVTGNNKKEMLLERKYWKQFYLRFTDFLYKEKKCFDNYVGMVIKIIRVFF